MRFLMFPQIKNNKEADKTVVNGLSLLFNFRQNLLQKDLNKCLLTESVLLLTQCFDRIKSKSVQIQEFLSEEVSEHSD
jgi:hypothetical protein